MYYRDQYGNVVEYSSGASAHRHGQYTNAIHPGGVGYHPLTREAFEFTDVTSWFDKYKMWFLYALIVVIIWMAVANWRSKKIHKSATSMFY